MADWTEDYIKHPWQNGEVITADRMNHIQNQLQEISDAVRQASSGNLYASLNDTDTVNSHTLSYRIKNMIQYGTNSDKPDAYNKLWIQDTTAQGLPAYLIPTLTEFDDLVKSFVAVFDETRSYKVGDYVSCPVKLEDSEGQDENNYKIYKCIAACEPANWETNSQYFTTTDVQILNDLILNVQKNIESINTTLNNVIENGVSIQYFDYGTLEHGYVNNSNKWDDKNRSNYLGSETYFKIPSGDITIKTTDVRFRIRLYNNHQNNNNYQMLNPNTKQLYDGTGNPYIQIMPNKQVTLNLSSYSGQTEDTQVVYFRFYFYHQDGTEATPDEASIILSQTKNLVTTKELEEKIVSRLNSTGQTGIVEFPLGEYEEGSISATGSLGTTENCLRSKDFLPIFQHELFVSVKPGTAFYFRFYDQNEQIISDLSTSYSGAPKGIGGKSGYGNYSAETKTIQYPIKLAENPILVARLNNFTMPKYWKWAMRTETTLTASVDNATLTYKNLIIEEDLLERNQDPWAAISALTAKINALENQLAMQPTDGHDALFSAEVADTVSKIDTAIAAERDNGGVPLCFAFVTDSHIDVPEFNSGAIYNNRNYWADTVANIKSVNNGIASYTYSFNDGTETQQTQKGFDAIVHGGDYITRCSNKMTAEKYLTRSAASLDSIARNFFGTIGNHDGNRQNQTGYANRNVQITKKEFNALVLATANGSMAVKSNPYDLTYYVDFVPQKIRMIFVDGVTNGDNYANLKCSYSTDEMMEEVKGYLDSAPEDYRFILVAHGTCVPELFFPESPSDIPYASRYQTMLAPYATRIIMHLHGHHHEDWIGGKTALGFYDVSMAQSVPGQEQIYSPTEYYNGDSTQGRRLKATNPGPNTDAIAPFNSIGATWAGSKASADATKFYEGRSIEDATYDCWTAFVVQPTLNKVKVIRFGAGGRRIASDATGYQAGYDNPAGSGLGGDCEFDLDPWPAT